jgi:hypothetical protein
MAFHTFSVCPSGTLVEKEDWDPSIQGMAALPDAVKQLAEVMRPLLLGWFVNCLILIPVAGMLLAGIGWTAVLMMVFEEVDEIEKLQAFGISAGINLCFFAIQFALMPVKHHL